MSPILRSQVRGAQRNPVSTTTAGSILNILFITFGLPVPPDSGARLRDFNLIKRVGKHHRVFVLSLLEFEDELQHAESLKDYCDQVDGVVANRGSLATIAAVISGLIHQRPVATVPFYYPELATKIARLTKQQSFDVVQFEHSFLAPYRSALAPTFEGATVLSMHNIGVQQYRSMLDMSSGARWIPAALKWLMMRGWEAFAANKFHEVIAVSDCDRERLLELGVNTKISVIENGVDCTALQPLPPTTSGTEELIFIGTMGYLPNRDAARYLVKEILPLIRSSRPGCQLNLVGSGGSEHLADLAEPGVVNVTGRVENPLPYYARSQVAVVPLRSGGGSRLKILEAMALGRPVVSTTLGQEGLSLKNGLEILIADDPQTFANQVIQLLENDSDRQMYAEAGRDRVVKDYDWDQLADQLLHLYENLVPSRAQP